MPRGCILGPFPLDHRSHAMTLCPIAIVAGCQKCPAFKVCPLKSVIGDAPKADTTKSTPSKYAARRKKK